MTKDELFAAIKAKYDTADLDDEVHQVKSMEASEINNEGIDAQLQYLYYHAGPNWLEEFYLETEG